MSWISTFKKKGKNNFTAKPELSKKYFNLNLI